MDSFDLLLHAVLDWVSPASDGIITVLVDITLGSSNADFLARRAGLRNRHHLARVLARDGLPPFQELRSWLRIARWIFEWEQQGTSLFRSATSEDLNPIVCYRMVQRVTGRSWTDLRALGTEDVLMQLRSRCRMRQQGGAVSDAISIGE